MNRIITALVLAAAPILSFAATTPARPTIEQLAAFPEYSSFTLSPDGKHVAALLARGEDRVIAVWRSDALDQAPTIIGTQKMKFSAVSFIKNDLLAVNLWQPYDLRLDRVTKTFISKLVITDLKGEKWNDPLPLPRAASRDEQLAQARTSPTVLDSLPNDPDHILVVNNVGSESGDVYKVNVRTFKSERIQRSEENVSGYVTDAAGNLRARLKLDVDGQGAFVAAEFRNPATGNWEEHFRSHVKNRDVTSLIGFAEDPNTAFILSNEGRDKAVILEYDIPSRTRKEVLFEHKFFDAADVIVNRFRDAPDRALGKLIGVVYQGPRGDDVQWTDPAMRALDAGLRQALRIPQQDVELVDPATGQRVEVRYPAERDYTIIGRTPDLSTVLIRVDGPSTPPEYHLFHNGSLSLLARAYPKLDARALGTTALVYYKARDGLDIPAFLTRPNPELCGPGPWPAVVHPHGGPWARDSMSFDESMWTPMLASRCLAVLRPQFRGSQGWGRKLWLAGDQEWGQKMQDDKDDGARWLIDQGIAQRGRIAMFGFSYGGYAAFAASVRPHDLYKCSIAGAGVSDIDRIWARFYMNPFFRQAQAHTVKGLSPLSLAAETKIPLMVFHGDRDQTVPLEQSEWFVDKAKSAGRPVEFHVIADYGHGPAWTREIFATQLRLIDDYLREGCGGKGL